MVLSNRLLHKNPIILAVAISSILLIFVLIATVDAQDASRVVNMEPVWSPKGDQIAFVSTRSGTHDIWVMNANGENTVNLTSEFPYIELQPEWSPDGELIAFLASSVTGSDIWVISPDGQHMQNLTANIDNDVGRLSWSPDGKYIAFIEDTEPFQSEVWVIASDGTNLIQLTSVIDGNFTSPQWLSDGKTVVFASWSRTDPQLIFIDTTDLDQPKGLSIDVIEFITSPIGNEIAYTVVTDKDHWFNDIGRLDLNKMLMFDLTRGAMQSLLGEINWSPDGRLIAFVSGSFGEQSDIWVIETDGITPVNLTKGDGTVNWSPDWSPDGTAIVFASNRSGNMDIWRMNADGTDPVNLTAASN